MDSKRNKDLNGSTENIKLTLYHFERCPFCVHVRVFMDENGIELPLKDILLEPKYREELVEGGGKRTVPCLRIDTDTGTRWMYESLDIIEFLKELYLA